MLQSSSSFSGVMEAANHAKNSAVEAENHVKHGARSKSLMSRINKKILWGAIIACISVLFCASCNASRKAISENNADQIIGVWKNVTPGKFEMIKIITKERWIWTYTTRDGKTFYSIEGTYTFDGNTYTENIESGSPNMGFYIGEKSIFKVRFEGNRKYITGGNKKETYDEVWERVECVNERNDT